MTSAGSPASNRDSSLTPASIISGVILTVSSARSTRPAAGSVAGEEGSELSVMAKHPKRPAAGATDPGPAGGAIADKADPGQYQRFLDAARELGCEEGMDRLDDALRRVAKAPPQPHRHDRRPRKEGEPEG